MKPFHWLKSQKRSAPELPYEPPIWFGAHSNGENFVPATARDRKIRKMILQKAAENAARLGIDRRQFLASSMGMVTSLWVINQVTACSSDSSNTGGKKLTGTGRDGGPGGGGDAGQFCAPPEAMFDEACANAIVGGKEFIFDIQTHWFLKNDVSRWPAYIQSFGPLFDIATEDAYINEIFCSSDTTMTALTAWPGVICSDTRRTSCGLPLSNDHMVASSKKINELAGNSQRVVHHVQILPQDPSGIDLQLRIMEEYYCQGLAAWKLYPGFKPGFKLDDENGEKVILKGLELGVNLFCVHKGLPIGNFFDVTSNYPDEIGKVAKKHPDANFIIYHSAICAGADSCGSVTEGPFDPNDPMPKGTNALIKSILDAGLSPGGNVYGETGTAFNQIKSDPTQSAHFFGKLMKYLGEDNVCWGTDSIINGSPQSQIETFRALTIPQDMQDKYGYPALDDARKAKILGLNSAKIYKVDPTAKRCQVDSCQMTSLKQQMDEEMGPRRHVFEQPNGPKTYEEWLEGAEEMKRTRRPG
jgi:predicted TIM-barrel fold metal-dependent hydrolase